MVVYDITDENSFKSCSKWLQDIDQVSSEEKFACTLIKTVHRVPSAKQIDATFWWNLLGEVGFSVQT